MKKVNHQNYDVVLKEAFSLFHHKSLDFLGLSLPPIVSFMETEIAEVDTTDDMMDLNFRLEDGSILHLEEETNLSRKDLIRFAHYDLRLYNRYHNLPCIRHCHSKRACPGGDPASDGCRNIDVLLLYPFIPDVFGGKQSPSDRLLADGGALECLME